MKHFEHWRSLCTPGRRCCCRRHRSTSQILFLVANMRNCTEYMNFVTTAGMPPLCRRDTSCVISIVKLMCGDDFFFRVFQIREQIRMHEVCAYIIIYASNRMNTVVFVWNDDDAPTGVHEQRRQTFFFFFFFCYLRNTFNIPFAILSVSFITRTVMNENAHNMLTQPTNRPTTGARNRLFPFCTTVRYTYATGQTAHTIRPRTVGVVCLLVVVVVVWPTTVNRGKRRESRERINIEREIAFAVQLTCTYLWRIKYWRWRHNELLCEWCVGEFSIKIKSVVSCV